MRFDDQLGAIAVDSLEFCPEESVFRNSTPVFLASSQDANPAVCGSRLINVLVAVVGISSDDVGHSFFPLVQQVLLHDLQLIDHLSLDRLPDSSITHPVEVLLQDVIISQHRQINIQLCGCPAKKLFINYWSK